MAGHVDIDEHRAAFDLRVHVSASDRKRVYELVMEFLEVARGVAPEGVVVCYTQLRPGHVLSPFKPTIEPKRRSK